MTDTTRKGYTAEQILERAAEERELSRLCCGDPDTACCSGCAHSLTNDAMFRQAAAQARVLEKLKAFLALPPRDEEWRRVDIDVVLTRLLAEEGLA